MTFEQFYRTLLKRWAIVVICFVFVGLGTYVGSSKLLKPSYTSSTLVEVIVRTGTSPFNSDNIQASQLLAETESNLATTNTVLSAVAARHKGLSVDDLAKNVTAAVKANTQLFEITVQDNDPVLAATLANEISTTLIQQQLQVTQQPAADGSFLVLAESARPALVPSRPNKLINTAAGLLVGLLLGILLAVLFESLDTRIRTKESLASLLKWPVLGTIWRTSSKATVISATGYSVNADAYGILRSDLEFASIDKPLQTLVVTSATPEDGKSVVAANLAISMARSGKSTLLIDANLRHPALYELFDIPSHAMGFSNAILAFRMSMGSNQQSRAGNDSENRDERSLSPFIRTVNIPNLSVMPSGPLPPSPSELLGSKAMQRFFIMLAQSGIEAVIFDTPSLLGLSDAVVLASKVDGTLVVVDITRAKRGDLRQANELLEQAGANILGCVVNKQREDHKNTPYKRSSYSYDSEAEKRGNKNESHDSNQSFPAPSSPTPVTQLAPFQERPPAARPVMPSPVSERPRPVNPVTPIPAPSVLAASVTSVPTTPVLPKPVTSSTPRAATPSPQRPVEVAASRPVSSSPQRPVEAATSRPVNSPSPQRPAEVATSRPVSSSPQKPVESAASRPASSSPSSSQRSTPSVPSRPNGSSNPRQSPSESATSESATSETIPSKPRESSSHSSQEKQDEKEKQQSSEDNAADTSEESKRDIAGEQTMLLSQVHQRGSGE